MINRDHHHHHHHHPHKICLFKDKRERAMLEAFKERHDISDVEHREMLEEMGWTVQEFETGKRRGNNNAFLSSAVRFIKGVGSVAATTAAVALAASSTTTTSSVSVSDVSTAAGNGTAAAATRPVRVVDAHSDTTCT